MLKVYKRGVPNENHLTVLPASIFASERFVMWKKPFLIRRNTWYVPVKKKKKNIRISNSEDID